MEPLTPRSSLVRYALHRAAREFVWLLGHVPSLLCELTCAHRWRLGGAPCALTGGQRALVMQ